MSSSFPSWAGLWCSRALTLALSGVCLWMETSDEEKSYRGLLCETPELSCAQIQDLKVSVPPSKRRHECSARPASFPSGCTLLKTLPFQINLAPLACIELHRREMFCSLC